MPDFLLILILIVLSIATLSSFIGLCKGEDYATSVFLSFFITTIVGFCWLYSAWTDTNILNKTTYSLVMVKMDDGSQVQAIDIGPFERINITDQFKKIFPDNVKIERQEKSLWKNGILLMRDKYRYVPVYPAETK